MPPKPKFTRDEITLAALKLVSQKGIDALTARELGAALGSSARPIFTAFKNMDELADSVRGSAMKLFENFDMSETSEMPRFKQIGMKMIGFARREPKLYQLLFMNGKLAASDFDGLYSILGADAELSLSAIEEDYSLDRVHAKRLFEHVWIYTFGLAALCAFGVCDFSDEELARMLTSEFNAMMLLLKSKENADKPCENSPLSSIN